MSACNTAVNWSQLHADVLALIFAHHHLRPRLQVVSLVCRRWREGVLRSVTSVDRYAPAILSSLPSLEHLVAGRLERAPPPTLRSLKYSTVGNKCQCVLLRGLTALTRLDLSVGHGCCEEKFHVIARNAATLTELKLSASACSAESIAFLTRTPMPALRSLEAAIENSARSVYETLIQLVTLLAPHLTRFVMHQWARLMMTGNNVVLLPACQTLVLPFRSDLALLNLAPAATYISLNLDRQPPANFVVTALKSLKVNCSAVQPWLLQCTGLERLSLKDALPFSADAAKCFPECLPMLRSLTVRALAPSVLHRLHCTQLTRLRLPFTELAALCPGAWRFPVLHKLLVDDVPPDGLPTVCRAVQRAQRLRSLKLALSENWRLPTAVLPLLSAASACGVERVRFIVESEELGDALRVMGSAHSWLHVSVEVLDIGIGIFD